MHWNKTQQSDMKSRVRHFKTGRGRVRGRGGAGRGVHGNLRWPRRQPWADNAPNWSRFTVASVVWTFRLEYSYVTKFFFTLCGVTLTTHHHLFTSWTAEKFPAQFTVGEISLGYTVRGLTDATAVEEMFTGGQEAAVINVVWENNMKWD